MCPIPNPADGSERAGGAEHAQHSDRDGGEALTVRGDGKGGVVGGACAVRDVLGGGWWGYAAREEGCWARDQEDADEGDKGCVLCCAGKGLVQEEVACVGCYGGGEEGEDNCVGNGEV